jgi:hypothetical protein
MQDYKNLREELHTHGKKVTEEYIEKLDRYYPFLENAVCNHLRNLVHKPFINETYFCVSDFVRSTSHFKDIFGLDLNVPRDDKLLNYLTHKLHVYLQTAHELSCVQQNDELTILWS